MGMGFLSERHKNLVVVYSGRNENRILVFIRLRMRRLAVAVGSREKFVLFRKKKTLDFFIFFFK